MKSFKLIFESFSFQIKDSSNSTKRNNLSEFRGELTPIVIKKFNIITLLLRIYLTTRVPYLLRTKCFHFLRRRPREIFIREPVSSTTTNTGNNLGAELLVIRNIKIILIAIYTTAYTYVSLYMYTYISLLFKSSVVVVEQNREFFVLSHSWYQNGLIFFIVSLSFFLQTPTYDTRLTWHLHFCYTWLFGDYHDKKWNYLFGSKTPIFDRGIFIRDLFSEIT